MELIFWIIYRWKRSYFKRNIKREIWIIKKGIKLPPLTIELQHKCKDGSIIWGEILSKQELDVNGNIIGYHGITRKLQNVGNYKKK